jgi:hypothetical protein
MHKALGSVLSTENKTKTATTNILLKKIHDTKRKKLWNGGGLSKS